MKKSWEITQKLLSDNYGNWKVVFNPDVLEEVVDRIIVELDELPDLSDPADFWDEPSKSKPELDELVSQRLRP